MDDDGHHSRLLRSLTHNAPGRSGCHGSTFPPSQREMCTLFPRQGRPGSAHAPATKSVSMGAVAEQQRYNLLPDTRHLKQNGRGTYVVWHAVTDLPILRVLLVIDLLHK